MGDLSLNAVTLKMSALGQNWEETPDGVPTAIINSGKRLCWRFVIEAGGYVQAPQVDHLEIAGEYE